MVSDSLSGRGKHSWETWSIKFSISKGSPPLPPTPPPPPTPSLNYRSLLRPWEPPSLRLIFAHFIKTFGKIEVYGGMFFFHWKWKIWSVSSTINKDHGRGQGLCLCFRKSKIFHSFLSNVGNLISVGHSTNLPMSMPSSVRRLSCCRDRVR